MEIVLGIAGVGIGLVSILVAWLQWQRPRPPSEAAARSDRLGSGSRPASAEAQARVFHDRVPVVSRFFTGRDHVLERLRASLRPGRATVVTQAIQGLGGVGKTSVAAALAESCRDEFEIVWWIRAEEPASLVTDLVALAPQLGVPLLDDPAQTAALVRRGLEATDRPWLLVFDNVPDQRSVEEWLPRRGVGSVLITSRSANLSLADEVVAVDAFPPDVAEEFLRQRVAHANPAASVEDLGPTADRLGGLPLALEQAGAWVAQVPNRRFRRFVELYDDAAHDPFPDGTRPTGYEHTATTTWRISLRAASAEAPLAERVMGVLSFFAPDEIPCQWLRDMGDDDLFHAAGSEAVDAALDALHAYSLAAIAPDDTLNVHRVIQAVTRRTAGPKLANAAIRTLCRQCPEDPTIDESWPELALITSHVLAMSETATAAFPSSAHDLCSVLNVVGTYQHINSALRAATATAATAQQIAGIHLGPDHPDALLSRLNLDSASQMLGRPTRSLALHEADTAACERVFGPDHEATCRSRNSLAYAYQTAGQIARAVVLFEAALAGCERALGDDHILTLISRNNLAQSYRAAGDLDRAVPLLESTLAHQELRLGRDHPSVLVCRNNLATALHAAGDAARAMELFRISLAVGERVLGSDHPTSIASREGLIRSQLTP